MDPILFNLYVSDLDGTNDHTCLQYADDTNVYLHAKPVNLKESISKVENTISYIYNWSNSNNLLFSNTKTKFMLFSTKQLSDRHNLNSQPTEINVNSTLKLERSAESKILEIHFDEHLSWNVHVNEVIRSCYSSIAALPRLKRFTPYHVCKNLSEALIMSKNQLLQQRIPPLTRISSKTTSKSSKLRS